MEDTLNHLKFLNVLSPRGVHIPNCDKKGFYKKKQVSGVPRMVFPFLSPGAQWGTGLTVNLQETQLEWCSANILFPLLRHVYTPSGDILGGFLIG